MKEPELIGVGIGPGGPGLLTMNGIKAITEADVVFAPKARNAERSIAADIVSRAGLNTGTFRELIFPMSRENSVLSSAWEAAAEPVTEALARGKQAVFITLGDPSVYSTWIYLRRAVKSLRPDTRFAVVPGIMAANAAAALLGVPLVEGSEGMGLLPLPDPVQKLDDYLALFDRLVIYKIGSRLPELARWVEERCLGDAAYLVVAAGQERERSGPLLSVAETSPGYLSLAVIGRIT
jgi:precorrin-2/cobalt-factor-2 C20-methyltransferase